MSAVGQVSVYLKLMFMQPVRLVEREIAKCKVLIPNAWTYSALSAC